VQHILAHQAIATEVKARLAEEFRKVPTGSPHDPQVLCGPVVSAQNRERLQSWMQEAEAGGAQRLAGGEISGNLLAPSLLTNVPEQARLRVEEAFGPVAHIDTYSDINAAITQLNHGRYGLQTGLYTQDIRTVLNVFSNLEVGGLIHNDVPAYRADPMPYGGNKASGFGREGPRYAVEEMTEPRLLVLRGD
jgi:acyl-CoA reductase-like NAD-dependent aldehyde dehydrogenase